MAALSIALTSNVWLPSPRPEYCLAEVQLPQAPGALESRRHSNEATPEPLGSLPVKEKLAVATLTRPAGLSVIEVSGAFVSTFH